MILTARYVRRPRRVYQFDWCERRIIGPHIYLYGSADYEKPSAQRRHLDGDCRPDDFNPKVRSALAQAQGNGVQNGTQQPADDRPLPVAEGVGLADTRPAARNS